MAKVEKGKEAYALIERDRKIAKLTRMIKGKERDVELLDRRLAVAKGRVASGDISKGEFQRFNIDITRRRKGVRSTVTKLERQRLNRERALKEKAEERAERRRSGRSAARSVRRRRSPACSRSRRPRRAMTSRSSDGGPRRRGAPAAGASGRGAVASSGASSSVPRQRGKG